MAIFSVITTTVLLSFAVDFGIGPRTATFQRLPRWAQEFVFRVNLPALVIALAVDELRHYFRHDPYKPKPLTAEDLEETLGRIEANDPSLTRLMIQTRKFGGASAQFWPGDDADMARLGVAIKGNNSLTHLTISCNDSKEMNHLVELVAKNRAFFNGLQNNDSIRELYFDQCDIAEGQLGREVIMAIGSKLEDISVENCYCGDGAGRLLASTSTCPNLRNICIRAGRRDDVNLVSGDVLGDLLSSMSAEQRLQLKELEFWGVDVEREGVEALATVLRDSGSTMRRATISPSSWFAEDVTPMETDRVTLLANSIRNNAKLETLNLGPGIDGKIFEDILCDTSSVNATYLSNHTLNDITVNMFYEDPDVIWEGEGGPPKHRFVDLMRLNRSEDKKRVATLKILQNHRRLPSLVPLLESDHLGALPHVLAWIDAAEDVLRAERDKGGETVVGTGGLTRREWKVQTDTLMDLENEKLSAIYTFARALPEMIVPGYVPPVKDTTA